VNESVAASRRRAASLRLGVEAGRRPDPARCGQRLLAVSRPCEPVLGFRRRGRSSNRSWSRRGNQAARSGHGGASRPLSWAIPLCDRPGRPDRSSQGGAVALRPRAKILATAGKGLAAALCKRLQAAVEGGEFSCSSCSQAPRWSMKRRGLLAPYHNRPSSKITPPAAARRGRDGPCSTSKAPCRRLESSRWAASRSSSCCC